MKDLVRVEEGVFLVCFRYRKEVIVIIVESV